MIKNGFNVMKAFLTEKFLPFAIKVDNGEIRSSQIIYELYYSFYSSFIVDLNLYIIYHSDHYDIVDLYYKIDNICNDLYNNLIDKKNDIETDKNCSDYLVEIISLL